MNCERCHRPTCPTLNPETLITPGILLDCERAKSAGLESQLATANARADDAEGALNDAETCLKVSEEARDAERSRADAFAIQLAAIDRGMADAREDRNDNPFPVEDPRAPFWRVGWMAERAKTEAANGAALREALRAAADECSHCENGVAAHDCTECEEPDGFGGVVYPWHRHSDAALAIPASGVVARVQALVANLLNLRALLMAKFGSEAPANHPDVVAALADADRALDAFAGHANKGGNHGS